MRRFAVGVEVPAEGKQVLINDTTHRLDGVRMHVLRDSSQGDLWGPDADSHAQEGQTVPTVGRAPLSR
jgi:hypothetical protein